MLVCIVRLEAARELTQAKDLEVKSLRGQISELVGGIAPVLNALAEEETEKVSQATPLETIINSCKSSWQRLTAFTKEAAEHVGSHVLAVVRSHYPGVDLVRLGKGLAKETSESEAEKLRLESVPTAKEMVKGIEVVI